MPEQIKQDYERFPPSESRLERRGNVVHIYKPEGTYTIIYGGHDAPIDPKQLPENIDGLFLETGMAENHLENPLRSLRHWSGRMPEKPAHQYKKLFPLLEEKQIPVYFADLKITGGEIIFLGEFFLALGETLAGTVIGAKLLDKVAQEAKMTRRDLLKVGAAVWLSTPLMSALGRIWSGVKGTGENATAEFKKFSHKVHPEEFLLTATLRNVVTAHKEEWQMMQMGNQPHMATILGAEHVGIEDQIQHSAGDSLAFLRASKPIWEPLVHPETFYKMVRFDFNGKEWQVGEILEVPELKELISAD